MLCARRDVKLWSTYSINANSQAQMVRSLIEIRVEEKNQKNLEGGGIMYDISMPRTEIKIRCNGFTI